MAIPAPNMRTSGKYDISMLGSCVQIRYAENPRRLADFFMCSFLDLRSRLGFRSRSGVVIFNRRRVCRGRSFGLNQPALLAVIVKDFGVATPVHRGLKLALHFVF